MVSVLTGVSSLSRERTKSEIRSCLSSPSHSSFLTGAEEGLTCWSRWLESSVYIFFFFWKEDWREWSCQGLLWLPTGVITPCMLQSHSLYHLFQVTNPSLAPRWGFFLEGPTCLVAPIHKYTFKKAIKTEQRKLALSLNLEGGRGDPKSSTFLSREEWIASPKPPPPSSLSSGTLILIFSAAYFLSVDGSPWSQINWQFHKTKWMAVNFLISAMQWVFPRPSPFFSGRLKRWMKYLPSPLMCFSSLCLHLSPSLLPLSPSTAAVYR